MQHTDLARSRAAPGDRRALCGNHAAVGITDTSGSEGGSRKGKTHKKRERKIERDTDRDKERCTDKESQENNEKEVRERNNKAE